MNDKKMNAREVNAGWRYSGPAIFLHWILAILITGLVALGWYMMSIEHEPDSAWYFDLHKSIGLLVFGLVLVRVAWRLGRKPAELPAGLPAWEVKLAAIVQWLLYACMVLMPVTGVLGGSFSKAGVGFFGLQLPAWSVPDHDTAERFFSIHSAMVWVLVVLVALHIAAGIKHLLVNRNGVFQRMWFQN